MFRRQKSQRARERATEYATCKDFQQIFDEEMSGLHLLAYLLTGDQAKAEQCFVAGLDDSIHGNPVFKQWARAWSKRAIIQNAIKAMAPSAQGEAAEQAAVPAAFNGSKLPLVFVMAVLEGYSVRECGAMLGSADQNILTTKSRVLQRLGEKTAQAAITRGDVVWNALLAQAQVA
jgi:hypothetical protein